MSPPLDRYPIEQCCHPASGWAKAITIIDIPGVVMGSPWSAHCHRTRSHRQLQVDRECPRQLGVVLSLFVVDIRPSSRNFAYLQYGCLHFGGGVPWPSTHDLLQALSRILLFIIAHETEDAPQGVLGIGRDSGRAVVDLVEGEPAPISTRCFEVDAAERLER